MKFGIKKCMVTTFFGDTTKLKKLTFVLGGEAILIRDSYRYLDMQVDSEFSIKNIINDWAERDQHTSLITYLYSAPRRSQFGSV